MNVNPGYARKTPLILRNGWYFAGENIEVKVEQSKIEEGYDGFNNEHQTHYERVFLPKFHPELNPIERCWNVMKRYIRKYNDGTIATLRKNMDKGLSPAILPISLIRKYFRLTWAYLIAYENGLDMIEAEKLTKTYRSHRAYNPTLDEKLDALYKPLEIKKIHENQDQVRNKSEVEPNPEGKGE